MKIFISAAEASSDVHGAELLHALKTLVPAGEKTEFVGVGGPKLQAAGLRARVDARQLMAMGFVEVIGRLPSVFRFLKQLELAALEDPPDIAVFIDYPDFHFRLARRFRKLGIPLVYYIPPKVWVWRTGRIHFLKENFSKILSILPFEEDFYRDHGVPVTYVGNPLVDELPLSLSRSEARASLGIPTERKAVVLMPGSRASELKAHLELMLGAVGLASDQLRADKVLRKDEVLTVLLPFPETAELGEVKKRVERWISDRRNSDRGQGDSALQARVDLDVRVSQGNSALCLVAADLGLIKSGTSTLEAALLRCPHAVVYKPSRVETWLFRNLVRYRGPVGLGNLVAGKAPGTPWVVPEILCEEATEARLAQEILRIFPGATGVDHASVREAMLAGFEVIRGRIGVSPDRVSPSVLAAREILQVLGETQIRRAERDRGAVGDLGKRVRSVGSFNAPDPFPQITHRDSLCRFLTHSGLRASRVPLCSIGSFFWSLGSGVARWAARRGITRSVALDCRVISVGNIQAGGAGKTPLVAQMGGEGFGRGRRFCILTGGYKGKWERTGGVVCPGDSVSPYDCGDEVALLHELCPLVFIGVGADRLVQYERVKKAASGPFDLVILDDGFQHHSIRKDLEVLALTSLRPSEILFRDGFSALKDANLLAWTKGEALPGEVPRSLPCVRVRYRLPRFEGVESFWLVTGIADGGSAFSLARESGYRMIRHISLEDHFAYDKSSVERLLGEARAVQCRIALTGKDWVKWRALGVSGSDVVVLEPELVFEEGRDLWSRMIWGE